MSDDFLDGLWKSLKSGWETGGNAGLPGTSVRSRPSFWNPLRTWRDEEIHELRECYDRMDAIFSASPFMSEELLENIVDKLAGQAVEKVGCVASPDVVGAVRDAALTVIGKEFFSFPRIDGEIWEKSVGLEEGVHLRQYLERKRRFFDDRETHFETACGVIEGILVGNLGSIPMGVIAGNGEGASIGDLKFDVVLVDVMEHPASAIEATIVAMFDKSIVDSELFHDLRAQLQHNLLVSSGIDPGDKKTLSRTIILPTEVRGKTPLELAEAYLVNTPFHDLLKSNVPFSVPRQSRVEHCHIIGGTGHGKTQMLQQLVLGDLYAAQTEAISVVVIDSQGDLIRKLSALRVFDPTIPGTLAGRFMLIDPSDIDNPPALNLFDPGIERMEQYSPHQRELAFNSLVDIYGRFFGALLGAELTARQDAVFRYLARLMLTIEGATIHTLIELMDDVSPFKTHIESLDPTARRFFEKEFSRKTFNATRQQIKQRLYAVLSIPTFDRLFSAPRSKINFFDALNDGSIILVNTAKDLLKTDGTAIFGRFILALIEHAIMERATLPETERTLTYLYVDEAQDYFDETIESLLVQGRKFNFGLVLAHQNLAQLSPRLRAVIMGNTTIKLAGGVSDSDARALGPDMRTTTDNLLSMKKREDVSEFSLSVRNLTPHALKVNAPLGYLENEPVLDDVQQKALLQLNRERIGYVPDNEKPRTTHIGQAEGALTDEVEPQTENYGHGAVQRNLAEQARERGFGVEIEYALPDGRRIDLALFGHHLNIAVEVSVTNREVYELSNIQKAINADFDQVWMIADDPDHREKIASYVRQSLSPDALARVTFGSQDDAQTWLLHFIAPIGDYSIVAGYEVESFFVPPTSLSDHDFRRDQIRYMLANRGQPD